MTRTLSAALLLALVFALPSAASHRRAHGNTVEYWVGAVPLTWNAVPSGKDPMMGQTLDPAETTFQTTIYRPFSANWAAHSFYVHAHRWTEPDGVTHDVQTVSPASSFAIRWNEDKVGTWLYHCHVETHMMNGMIGLYVVTK